MHSRLQAVWKFRKAVSVQYGSAVLQIHNLTVLVYGTSFASGAVEFHFPVGSKFKSSLFKIILHKLDPDSAS